MIIKPVTVARITALAVVFYGIYAFKREVRDNHIRLNTALGIQASVVCHTKKLGWSQEEARQISAEISAEQGLDPDMLAHPWVTRHLDDGLALLNDDCSTK